MNEINFEPILMKIGRVVREKAIDLCPFDMGELAASINYKVEGNTVTIFTDNDHAEDMEFGRPAGFDLEDNEKEEIAKWAKRHGLPAFPVIRKIEKKGIEVGTIENPRRNPNNTFRPFMRPALHQSLGRIEEIVRGK